MIGSGFRLEKGDSDWIYRKSIFFMTKMVDSPSMDGFKKSGTKDQGSVMGLSTSAWWLDLMILEGLFQVILF